MSAVAALERPPNGSAAPSMALTCRNHFCRLTTVIRELLSDGISRSKVVRRVRTVPALPRPHPDSLTDRQSTCLVTLATIHSSPLLVARVPGVIGFFDSSESTSGSRQRGCLGRAGPP